MNGFQHVKGIGICHLGRGVSTPGFKPHFDLDAGPGRRPFDRSTASKHDKVGNADVLLRRSFYLRKGLQRFFQLLRLISRPIFLRGQTNSGAIRSASEIGAPEGPGAVPGRSDQF